MFDDAGIQLSIHTTSLAWRQTSNETLFPSVEVYVCVCVCTVCFNIVVQYFRVEFISLRIEIGNKYEIDLKLKVNWQGIKMSK